MDNLEQLLLARAPGALDRLVNEQIRPVHRLVTLILGAAATSEDVEEVVSDTFTRVWNRIEEFDPARSSLHSWVLVMAKYTALDRRRSLLRSRFAADGEARVIPLESAPDAADDATPEDEALRQESSERLRQGLERLAPADRDLLVRRYFFEESIADLARDLGLTRTATDNRLWRARQALKNVLTAMEGVQEHVR